MLRKIVYIDEPKCNGCGICVAACHEGAMAILDGKAKLSRDDYCDGLGNCLPACPQGAITIIEREALPYDEAAVAASQAARQGVCPGRRMRVITPSENGTPVSGTSRLRHWPVQLKLVPINAPSFTDADLLIAADCTAYAYGRFHDDFIKERTVLIACPKLDDTDYRGKLTEIFRTNSLRSITLTRMEVPCCGGLEQMVRDALLYSGKTIPLDIKVISLDGKIM